MVVGYPIDPEPAEASPRKSCLDCREVYGVVFLCPRHARVNELENILASIKERLVYWAGNDSANAKEVLIDITNLAAGKDKDGKDLGVTNG